MGSTISGKNLHRITFLAFWSKIPLRALTRAVRVKAASSTQSPGTRGNNGGGYTFAKHRDCRSKGLSPYLENLSSPHTPAEPVTQWNVELSQSREQAWSLPTPQWILRSRSSRLISLVCFKKSTLTWLLPLNRTNGEHVVNFLSMTIPGQNRLTD